MSAKAHGLRGGGAALSLACDLCGRPCSRLWVRKHGPTSDMWTWVCDQCATITWDTWRPKRSRA